MRYQLLLLKWWLRALQSLTHSQWGGSRTVKQIWILKLLFNNLWLTVICIYFLLIDENGVAYWLAFVYVYDRRPVSVICYAQISLLFCCLYFFTVIIVMICYCYCCCYFLDNLRQSLPSVCSPVLVTLSHVSLSLGDNNSADSWFIKFSNTAAHLLWIKVDLAIRIHLRHIHIYIYACAYLYHTFAVLKVK